MKWILIILGSLAIAACLIVLVGSILPRRHVATRSARVNQRADVLFGTLRDFAALPSWRTGLTSVELLSPQDGHARYRELSRHGAITYQVDEEKPPERLVSRIADETLPFGGTWTFELSAEPGGTRVRITEHGIVKNPVFRFMARFVFGYTSTMDAYLRDLGRKFGEDVTPN